MAKDDPRDLHKGQNIYRRIKGYKKEISLLEQLVSELRDEDREWNRLIDNILLKKNDKRHPRHDDDCHESCDDHSHDCSDDHDSHHHHRKKRHSSHHDHSCSHHDHGHTHDHTHNCCHHQQHRCCDHHQCCSHNHSSSCSRHSSSGHGSSGHGSSAHHFQFIPVCWPYHTCHPFHLNLAGISGDLNFEMFRARGCKAEIEIECAGHSETIKGIVCSVGIDSVSLKKHDRTVVTVLKNRICKIHWPDPDCNPCKHHRHHHPCAPCGSHHDHSDENHEEHGCDLCDDHET